MLFYDLLVSSFKLVDVLDGFCEDCTLWAHQQCFISFYVWVHHTLLTLAALEDCASSSSPPSSIIERRAGTASRSSEILSFKFVRYFRSMSLCAARSPVFGFSLPLSLVPACFLDAVDGPGRDCAADGHGGETGFGPWFVLVPPSPALNNTGIPLAIPPKLKLRFEPSPPKLDPEFMAMEISRLCSASFIEGPYTPFSESMRIPGCGLSQLRGVEYRPSRGGTSCGGALSIPVSWSARLTDEKPSSSDNAFSRALSSRKSLASLVEDGGIGLEGLGTC